MPLNLFAQLELKGFLQSTDVEPGLLLQIQWKDERFRVLGNTIPDLTPVVFEVESQGHYSSLHQLPYDSLFGLPPTELDISRSFSAAEFSTGCSLYLAPKIASFVRDLASSFRGISPPSLLVLAELTTLHVTFIPELSFASTPPPEELIPRCQGPFPRPRGIPFGTRLFHLDRQLSEAGGMEVRGSSEQNRSRASGGSAEAISKLKKRKLVAEDDEAGDCSVCLQEMSAMKELLAMPCDHTFHEQCILSWLEKNESCPLCRSQL